MSSIDYSIVISIISALAGIIGVIAGSLLTYHLEIKKLKKENNLKLLRNIYYKIYTEIELCFLSQNNFSKDLYMGLEKGISIHEIKNHLENLLENNIELIDSELFNIYHIIKSDQYSEDNTSGLIDYKYLKLFAQLSLCMITIMKKSKMSDKKLFKRLSCLYYEYSVWFFLMERLMDWEQVQNILNKNMFFKRTFKTIMNSILIKKLYKNKHIKTDEFIQIFEDYCRKKITFPIFSKYFWK
jgi:hypothetical protein